MWRTAECGEAAWPGEERPPEPGPDPLHALAGLSSVGESETPGVGDAADEGDYDTGHKPVEAASGVRQLRYAGECDQ